MERSHYPCKGHIGGISAMVACLVCLLVIVPAGCDQPALPAKTAPSAKTPTPTTPFAFRDVAPFIGVKFQYDHHPEADYRTILESLGGGVAMMDYDADGLLDLTFPGGGMYGNEKTVRGVPLGMFRNRGHWNFEPVAAAARADIPRHYSHGATSGDYDRDGFPDVLITGYGGLQLWHNQGDGTFVEAQDAAGLSDRSWSTSAAWGDVNGDGELDLYVAHYVNWSFDNNPACPSQHDPGERDICSPKEFEPLPDTLHISQGDGTFRDGSKEAGLRTDGKGLGVVLADLDADSDLDVFVANDTTANFLYLNDGAGKFSEVGELHGAAASATGTMDGSMGVDVCDFNRDGLPDLFVANFESEDFALYRNLGQAQFEHDSRRAGISAAGTRQVAFGTQCGDLDLDGDDEILVANGHTSLYPTFADRRQKPILFWYDVGAFQMVQTTMGQYMDTPHLGRGLAMGDLDDDGDLDAAVSHLEEPVAVLRNDQTAGSQWLSIRLIGVQSARDPIGARVVLHTDRDERVAQRCGGRSYLSTPENLIRFGIPAGETIRHLSIQWPSGVKQDIPAPDVNVVLTIVEPSHGL